MPSASRTEVEAKFVVPDGETFDNLLSLEQLGEYRLVPRGEQEVVDHYLDTAQHDLLRGGYACRRRESATDHPAVIAVKGLGGARGAVHRRTEHEVPVPRGATLETWPAGPPRDIVTKLVGDRPLVELFALRQERVLRDVKRRGRRVAVLSLDRVRLDDSTSSLTHELEIELTPFGALNDLRTLERLLRPFDLRPQPQSKFERALALVESRATAASAIPPASGNAPRANPGHPPGRSTATRKSRKRRIPVQPTDPMTEAGRKILRVHFEKMLAKEPGTRAGVDPEELHDMRVATRRQRAALRIVRPYFRKQAILPIRDGLRTLGRLLGAVRDLDVLLEVAGDYRAHLDRPDAAALQPLLDSWIGRRDAARLELIDHLDSADWTRFKEEFGHFLDIPGAGARKLTAESTPRPALVAQVVPAAVWSHYGAVGAFATVLPWAAVATLHALRIETKRLRYLLEFFEEVLDPVAHTAVESLVALQDHLGELQDANVTMGLVRDFLAGPEAAARPEAAAAAGRYLETRAAGADELRRTVGGPWERVTSAEFKSCLARAVAAL